MARIRPYRPADLDALYDICLKTGEAGADATALYRDPRLLGAIYAGPYAALEPHLALVAEDDEGVAGYVLGTADTRAFEARCAREWWPALRRQHTDTADVASWRRSRDDWAAFQIHHPAPAPQAAVEAAPAHLHIDLLPRLQGRGLGRAMLDAWLAKVGDRAHLACDGRNARALRFYEVYGFRRLTIDGARREAVWMAIGG